MNLSDLCDGDTLSESVTEAGNMTNVTTSCDEYCQESSEINCNEFQFNYVDILKA